MKYLLLLTVSFLFVQNFYAQSIRDSVFNNVIRINDTDVTSNSSTFLIDIPIKTQKEPIIIFKIERQIPTKLFFSRKSFLPDQNEILLIEPDWEYYKSIRKSEDETGLHLYPVVQNKFYHIQRNNTGFIVDSLTVRMDDSSKPVALNFKKPELNEIESKFYYLNCYGSTCCPKDPRWEFYETFQNNIKIFEEKNKVVITKEVYSKIYGKEGEHCLYYPLSDLTNEQKVAFLSEITGEPYPKIYVPIIFKITN